MNDKAPELLPSPFKRGSREGGYTFVTAPDYPGFSFMLSPDEDDTELNATFVKFIAINNATRPTPAERPSVLDKIRHKGIFIERQLQDGGDYLFICHTGIAKFLPDLYPTKAAAIAAIDSALLSERPVPQVREALDRARDLLRRLLKGKKLGVEYAEANQICHEITAAITARPSDAAVAWRELECVLNDLMLTVHDCRSLPTFKLRKELRKILEPLYAIPHSRPRKRESGRSDKGK